MIALKKEKKLLHDIKLISKEAKMRSTEGLMLLIMALLSFCIRPSASPLVHSQENVEEKAGGEDFISNKYDQGSGTAIAHENKFGHGSNGADGKGGHAAGSDGNGGGSHSPYVQGGGGVTPLYAAGAGNNHHYHRGGENHEKSRTGLATFVATTLSCFLLCIKGDW